MSRDSIIQKEERSMRKTLMIAISALVVIGVIAGIVLVNSHKNTNVPANPPVVTTNPTPTPTPTTPTPTPTTTQPVKPTETTKVTPSEAKDLVIFGDRIDLYEKLQLATTKKGILVPVANVPEGTKVYAPFDGYVVFSSAEIAGYKVRPATIYRVQSLSGEDVSMTFFTQTWSDYIGNKLVKKGDYIGTIGSSAPIFDTISSVKGNNLPMDVAGSGFDGLKYSSIKDYIKGFINFAETFEVKKLDMSSILPPTQGK